MAKLKLTFRSGSIKEVEANQLDFGEDRITFSKKSTENLKYSDREEQIEQVYFKEIEDLSKIEIA